MKTYVFSDEHNCDHTYVLAADAQRALDVAMADNRSYINERHENMKTIETLQAQLRQVEGENELLKSGQRYMALEKERDTLRQLVEALPVVDGRMDVECGACYYIRSFVAGQYGIVCGLMTEQSTAMAIKALLEYRATQAAQDAKDAPLTEEQRHIENCCEKPHDCKWGGLGGCGYAGRKYEAREGVK